MTPSPSKLKQFPLWLLSFMHLKISPGLYDNIFLVKVARAKTAFILCKSSFSVKIVTLCFKHKQKKKKINEISDVNNRSSLRSLCSTSETLFCTFPTTVIVLTHNRQCFGNYSDLRIQLTYNNESEQQKILGSILLVTLETSYLMRICHLSKHVARGS